MVVWEYFLINNSIHRNHTVIHTVLVKKADKIKNVQVYTLENQLVLQIHDI